MGWFSVIGVDGIYGVAVPIKYTEATTWSCHKIVEYPERLLEDL